MLTKVYLEGAMGERFGREWEFQIDSPAEALRMVDANSPGVFNWIRDNLQIYSKYRIVCERANGVKEEIGEEELTMQSSISAIYFVPLVEGEGSVARIVIGAALIYFSAGIASGLVAAGISGATAAGVSMMGASMILGGVVEMLSPRPTQSSGAAREDKTSYYFNGGANTMGQGAPVQLIYGRVRVGSHAISAALSVDQLLG